MSWLDTLEGLYKNRDFAALSDDERAQAARDVVNLSALASCALTAAPLPFSELILATPVHIAMVIGVGHVYGRSLSKAEAARLFVELATAAGASLAARSLWIALSKLIAPGFGVFLVLPYVYGVTWALGRLAMLYFEDPESSPERMKDKFGEFVDEGKKGFRMDAFKDFVWRSGQEVHDFAAGDRARPGTPSSEAVEASWEEGPVAKAAPSPATATASPASSRGAKTTPRTRRSAAKASAGAPRTRPGKAAAPSTKTRVRAAPGRKGPSRGGGRSGGRAR